MANSPDARTRIPPGTGEVALLLAILDESYDKKAWHGPNLKGSIRGLSAEQAAWRPHPDRHSIADYVVHCAYWKYALRRRLRGDKRGSFPLKGSNWFAIASPLTEATWKEFTALLETEHRLLRAEVASLPVERLHEIPKGGKVRFSTQIFGIAAHDVYHAGQIQLLKRLQSVGE
jgi:hypothetical protein